MTDKPTPLIGGRRKAALGFIFATTLMDVISLGIMIPVLPNLVKELVGGDTAIATLWTGVFATCWGVMQFFCGPVLGMLSDRFGRRPVLLISIFGLSVDYLFMALAPTLGWLFVGRVINGMTAASFSTASAYIADVTTPENRAKSFGLIGAAFGAGFMIGPAIGGALGEIDLRLPFFFAAGIGLINWFYGLLILPESLPPENRVPRFNWRRANPLGSFTLLRSHHDLLGLAGVTFLFQLAHNAFPSIFVLYTGHRFGWSPLETGMVMFVVGAANIVVQATLVGRAVKSWGERGCLIVGLASGVVGFAIYALAPNGLAFMIGVPIFALSALIGPGIQGLMTRRVGVSEQGQLQGANAGIMGVAAVLGPPMFTGILAWSLRHEDLLNLPGLALLAACGLMILALTLSLQVAKPPKPD